jgi:hypothetical protein
MERPHAWLVCPVKGIVKSIELHMGAKTTKLESQSKPFRIDPTLSEQVTFFRIPCSPRVGLNDLFHLVIRLRYKDDPSDLYICTQEAHPVGCARDAALKKKLKSSSVAGATIASMPARSCVSVMPALEDIPTEVIPLQAMPAPSAAIADTSGSLPSTLLCDDALPSRISRVCESPMSCLDEMIFASGGIRSRFSFESSAIESWDEFPDVLDDTDARRAAKRSRFL